MDFSKIKDELRKRHIPITDFIINKLHMSPTGFNDALRNKTLTIDRLEEISELIGVPITHWFSDQVSMVREQHNTGYSKNSTMLKLIELEAEVKNLKDKLKDKEKIISLLEHQLLGEHGADKTEISRKAQA